MPDFINENGESQCAFSVTLRVKVQWKCSSGGDLTRVDVAREILEALSGEG
ncbi:hypothetical protein JCM15831A_00050 [Asaia astilbis]